MPLPGHFNVENALAAIGACHALGVPARAAAAALASAGRVPGRFEPVDEGQPFAVLVDYAHTPDSLENALGAARELTEGRLIAVFGCGGDRDREKRPLMGEIAARLSDACVVTSDNPRSEEPEAIIAEILAGMTDSETGEIEVEPDRRAAIALALRGCGARRHRGDRRQGPRAGAGARRTAEDPLRRPRGGEGGAAQAGAQGGVVACSTLAEEAAWSAGRWAPQQ